MSGTTEPAAADLCPGTRHLEPLPTPTAAVNAPMSCGPASPTKEGWSGRQIHRTLDASRDVGPALHPAAARSGAAASPNDVHPAETLMFAPSPGYGPGPAADGRGGRRPHRPTPCRHEQCGPRRSPPGPSDPATPATADPAPRPNRSRPLRATSCRHEQCGPPRSPPAPLHRHHPASLRADTPARGWTPRRPRPSPRTNGWGRAPSGEGS